MIKYPIYEITSDDNRSKIRPEHNILENNPYYGYFIYRRETFRNKMIKCVYADISGRLFKVEHVQLERQYEYWSFLGKLRVNLKLRPIEESISLDEFKNIVKEKILEIDSDALVDDIENAETILEVINCVIYT